MTHNQICELLTQCCSHPKEDFEILNVIGLNVALGNKDNHSRNTAIQRLNNGITATDSTLRFCTMWLHPDGIARTTRWQNMIMVVCQFGVQ